MKSTPENNLGRDNQLVIPAEANFVQQGDGLPVILVHGIAASLHDWDDLIPALSKNGFASYALDLLGHGDSPKPDSGSYHMDWIFDHFLQWVRSLRLTEPAVLIGHSLGGHVALEYARRVSAWTRGLILVNPFYSRSQLHHLFQRSYSRRNLRGTVAGRLPRWLYRVIVDIASLAMPRRNGTMHSLPERIRVQTALDYTRTAPGVYNVTNDVFDLTGELHRISVPTLVTWGDNDRTLSPASFPKLVESMPRARGHSFHAGHVPHQSHAEEFNKVVLELLQELA
jgi:pimeloyl-ACP methyl ester carboxylesterase